MYKRRLLLVLVLVMAVGLSGCSSLLSFFRKPATLEVKPGAEVEVAVDAEVELEAVLKDKKGKEVTVKAADIKWTIEDVEEAEGSTDETEEPGPVAKLSAATGKKVKVTGLRVGEATVTVAYDKLEATVTVTVTEEGPEEPEEPEEPGEPGEPLAFPLFEDFSAESVDHFFSADYKALPGTTMPLYVATSGQTKMELQDGKLKLGDARFAIGMSRDKEDKTTADDQEAGGVLDLTKKYRITIEYTATEGTDTKEFQVFVDNNTSSAGDSMHGNPSRIYKSALKDLPESPIVFEAELGTATSFLQFRQEKDSAIWIDSIKIEYVDGE